MTRMLLQTIEQIGREKNIPPDVIIDAVEEAMAVAAKKFYKTEEEMTKDQDQGNKRPRTKKGQSREHNCAKPKLSSYQEQL